MSAFTARSATPGATTPRGSGGRNDPLRGHVPGADASVSVR
jgi:hypothetical protein